ncbi:hypothetical protein ACIBEJ_27705 [Nonomuraea sp. NPDC050790]|uniref:hypothetical protein n=1 Tax=Nonomuraea sp. NPDC050790 TaxID=3364371 RepID=UPI00379E8417
MDAMQVLAHQTAMGYEDSLRTALPGAPRRPGRDVERVRVRLARTLRRTADHLDPAPAQTVTG